MSAVEWVTPPRGAIHRGWRCELKVKDLLDDQTGSPAVAAAARTLHERLEKFRAEAFGGRWAKDDEIEQISDEFHTIGFVDGDAAADCDHFNAVLNGLYDWADDERVWVA